MSNLKRQESKSNRIRTASYMTDATDKTEDEKFAESVKMDHFEKVIF